MKKFILSTVLLAAGFTTLNAQDNPDAALKALRGQIPPLVSQQKYDEVIPLAERIAKLEKKTGGKNSDVYFSALQAVSRFRLARLESSIAGNKTGIKDRVSELQSLKKEFEENVEFANNTGDALKIASAVFDLASFRQRFKDQSPEVAALFLQSLTLREKALPADSEPVISSLGMLASTYFITGDFENFLPINQRYLAVVEKKFGPADKRLVPALKMYGDLLDTTDRAREAGEVARLINAIEPTAAYKPVPARSVLNRGGSDLNLAFGNPVQNSLDGGAILAPDPTGATRDHRWVPAGGIGYATMRDNQGVSLTEQPPDPRRSNRVDIPVSIIVDENGVVELVEPETTDAKMSRAIKERASKWKFRPLESNGVKMKMRSRFSVAYYK